METVMNFDNHRLSDGTVASVRTLRAATEVTFVSSVTSQKHRFYAILSEREYFEGEGRKDDAECPRVIVWTIAVDERPFRQKLESSGIASECLEEFFNDYQIGTGWGCWIGRRRARAKVELRFDQHCLPTI